ncbi:MAG TPA: M1 family metallopeptidase [Caulobacteraceae bacterium]|nr:M1 family metallopeptidase [Caulobacteraceae bacterium]
MRHLLALAAVGALAFASATSAAEPAANPYDPLVTFGPLTLPDPPNAYRSGDGAPGPAYWQNQADYQIKASLDAATKTLSGEEVITYTNNSPDVLDVLWLQLDQNIYRKDARSAAVGGGFRRTAFTDGDVLDAVEVEQGGRFVAAPYLVSDTRLQVRLPAEMRHGGKTRLRIRWHYTVPGVFGGRTAWTATKNGDVFDIAQWYPRMEVYDDLRGWDTLPYLGQEFYLEYGTFDYAVTVPADMIVAGSGELMNPAEALTPLERARLAQARASDKTVMIRTADEVVATPPAAATKTWRFHMDRTRDVSFAASRAFVWDAAGANLPDGKTALAQSVYPAENGGDGAWGRSTEYLKFAVEEFSRRWYPYPWPNAINVGGPVGGMEYPALLFDSMNDKGKNLFYLTVHEIGHTYFPMVVGTDERRWQWMDEGLNTFIDTYESDAFQNGVYGPKRDAEFAPGPGAPADQIAALIADPAAPPIMVRADVMPARYGHPISYFKTAYGLVLLREDILGPDRFDPAFRKFIRDWAYKHPTPSDFFRAMASEGGEDLDWFWRGWFFEQWPLDMAITNVGYEGGDPAKGAKIDVANLGQLVAPATLRVVFADGASRDIRMPAETWIQSGAQTVALDSTQPIKSAVLDPDHRLPARDRTKMSWTAP